MKVILSVYIISRSGHRIYKEKDGRVCARKTEKEIELDMRKEKEKRRTQKRVRK